MHGTVVFSDSLSVSSHHSVPETATALSHPQHIVPGVTSLQISLEKRWVKEQVRHNAAREEKTAGGRETPVSS